MILSTFKSIQKAYVDLVLDRSWREIVEVLLHHYDVDNKEDVELYNMVEFKTLDDPTVENARKYHYINGVKQNTFDTIPNTVRRCKNNVISITGIVLDVDENKTLEETMRSLDGIEYVIYTTFNHSITNHRFRVVIPFSRPLLACDIEGRQQDIIDVFPDVDMSSFSVSQSFYFHSGKNDSISYWNLGEMVDPYDFKIAEPKVVEQVIYDKPDSSEMDHHMEVFKMLYPTLNYSEWIRVTWACCNEIGNVEGINLMRYYYPESNKGEYDKLLSTKYSGKRCTLGTIKKMINDKRPKHVDRLNVYQQHLVEMKLIENILKEKRNARTE